MSSNKSSSAATQKTYEGLDSKRGIWALPKIELFYELLVDRIHMVLELFLKEKFTVFVNALPRNHKAGERIEVPRFDDFTLVFAGIKRQREFLGKPVQDNPLLDHCWNRLHDTWQSKMKYGKDILDNDELNTESAVIAPKLYTKFKQGRLRLKDIWKEGMGTLTAYFSPKNEKGKPIPLRIFQEEEKIILSSYFEIKDYRFLSVPLIQFAEFDGVIHIIYHKKDHKNFVKYKRHKVNTPKGPRFVRKGVLKYTVGNIIRAISREYEELILNWDLVGDSKQSPSIVKEILLKVARSPQFYEIISRNPILKELGFHEYYDRHYYYIEKRIEQSDEVPLIMKQQYHRIAIMSILIDSYTHNISAHSLVALEGWFKQRAMLHWGKKLESGFLDIPLIRDKCHFDIEIYQFFRFLLDKGAFWTGLTRDQNFGGRTDNLFNVLWYDFVNNPLYLGTIAYTEGILRLNINITFLDNNPLPDDGIFFRKGVLADGNFVSIDLQKLNKDIEVLNRGDEPEMDSYFVVKGQDYDRLSDLLKEREVFFPGGIVGKHALFTIWENEIRNVKHYSQATVESMNREGSGLTLNISIEDGYYPDGRDVYDTGKPQYYKIGTWLKHPVYVSQVMMKQRLESLNNDIITENYRPKMGGTYQDKICAAMLFNNPFSAVQNRESERDQRFYPWIKAGFSAKMDFTEGDVIEDVEMSARRYLQQEKFADSRKLFDAQFKDQTGFYKKFFHLWRGEDIYHLGESDVNTSWENLSRFRFIYLPDRDMSKYKNKFQSLREKGIIRIINNPAKTVGEAYSLWLRSWLQRPNGEIANWSIVLGTNAERKQYDAEIYWDQKQTTFIGSEYEDFRRDKEKDVCKEFFMVHGKGVGNPKSIEFKYRNHGIFIQHFCKNNKYMDTLRIEEELAAELLEVLATRICVFDRRIAKWFDNYEDDAMQMLGCEVYEENEEKWQEVKLKQSNEGFGFLNYHFLVVHLSFIESFKRKNSGEKYTEETIDQFIEEEILEGRSRPNNFIFVVTSGRGREQWRETIQGTSDNKKDFTSYVTFRPVESLISAVESSLTKSDDLEMKYQMVKVLIGS